MTSTAGSFAAGVSRVIRENVMRPLPSGTPGGRNGVRVSRCSWSSTPIAHIMVDLGTSSRSRRVANHVEAALGNAGYQVERIPGTDGDIVSMYASRAA